MSAVIDDSFTTKISAKLDARGVAKLYGITLADLARTVGKKEDPVRKNAGSAPLQAQLGILVDCFDRLFRVMAEDIQAARRWLNRPNRALDGERPIALLQSGDLPTFRAIVRELESASYS